MGISFVSGSMLNEDLTRTTDLAFNGNLLYLDVNSNRVGINTLAPGASLEVVGNILVGNITIPNIGNVSLANVNINNLADPVQDQDAATKKYVLDNIGNIATAGNLTFSNTTISTNLANGNITLSATGNQLVIVGGTAGFVIPCNAVILRRANMDAD